MILDKQLVFSDAQAVTTAAATDSTNIVDLGAAGNLENLHLVVRVDTSVTSGGSATVAFSLVTDDVATFDSAAVTLISTAAIAKTALTAGTEVIKALVPAGVKRYLKVVITPAVADLTAGKFDAFLTLDVKS